MASRTNEAAFETVIEAHLLVHGYTCLVPGGFDRERAIFPETVLAFIRETQPTEWAKLEALHGAKTGEQVLADLCKWLDANGLLATLRHGFKCYGRTLRVAYFKAAHELNPELEAHYAANRLGLTRQLRFSPRSEKSLDVTLSLNGISRRHGGAQESAHRADRGRRDAPVPARPRSARADLRVQASHARALRRRHRGRAHDHAASWQHRISCPSTRAATAALATRPTRPGAPTARRISGKRSCSATACSTSLRASSIYRSTRSETTRGAR